MNKEEKEKTVKVVGGVCIGLVALWLLGKVGVLTFITNLLG